MALGLGLAENPSSATTSGGTEMLNKAVVPLLGLLIVVFAGCASSESAMIATLPSADVNGTWTGGTARGAETYTLVLTQTGANVTGTLSGAGTADGPIEGIMEGNTIRLREASGYGNTPALTVKDDQITGFVRGTTLTLRRVK
jgi:hypothetical protein